MSDLRFEAIKNIENRKPVTHTFTNRKTSEYFGENVFSISKMQEYLPVKTFEMLKQSINKKKDIDLEVADAVANAMKSWAIEKGVTHYTHWFQPLTGLTAEKHDSFFSLKTPESGIEEFKGIHLIQQEPDASSFPSGSLRNTFEARGYTAWDISSPAFLIESQTGKTLCIPTVFVSYTGESLDNKAPLLRSIRAIDRASTEVCKIFDTTIKSVTPSLGIEQEFFLIDKSLYYARPDLVMCDRTVFGRVVPKGQQLNDHYFGSIPIRVQNFFNHLEVEAYKLGIPLSTRHNEVAPSQFEVAPFFEEAHIALDHNQLLMDLMQKVAEKHDFKVLFHEKPFANLNGSGKHNNWSLITDTGVNLLSLSSKATYNLRFLTFFINIIKAVHDHASLLRASIASIGNDYRLGANEAPPAIISIFIGSTLTKVINNLMKNEDITINKGENPYIKLGISEIPSIFKDNTDRNRTSPFAFTGNKFEFRAVGSSANASVPMSVLNTVVAQQLKEFSEELKERLKNSDEKKEFQIVHILKNYLKKSKNVLFEGNGYSIEWEKEAKKRGLPNIKSTPEAIDTYTKEESIAVFEKNHVMNRKEIMARHEIMMENYLLKVQIESRLVGEIAFNHIIPTAIEYQNKLLKNAKACKSLKITPSQEVLHLIEMVSKYIKNIYHYTSEMIEERKRINKIEDTKEKILEYHKVKEKYFEKIRKDVDRLELIVEDKSWPLPKYRELLFLR